ncbi:MAG: polysaccharide deacetylase family protein [Patescibacteria group bacterium]|nr:polysaccharide deacetylase family protein [Patescibacteria group bacterium]
MFQSIKFSFLGFLYKIVCLILYFVDVIFDRHAKVVVLCYKTIGRSDPDSVSIDNFKKQINILLKHRNPVSLYDVYYHILDKKALVKKSFAVTFDGGDKSILLVKDFLKENGIKPTVFVISDRKNSSANHQYDCLDKRNLQRLSSEGWDIGCHSDSHADLGKLSSLERKKEIRNSKLKLKKLGFNIRFFSYPYGKYSQSIVSSVKKARYWMALSYDDDVVLPKSSLYAVPRIVVGNFFSEIFFLASLSPTVILLNKFLKRSDANLISTITKPIGRIAFSD